jgi:hypothetical protein
MTTPHSSREMTTWMGLGAVLVLVGVLVAVFGNRWLGVIVALVGLIPFGGLARGRWE